MRFRRPLGLALGLVLTLAGCSTPSPHAMLQERANALVDAANAGDAAALRAAATLLLQEVNEQDARADLPATRAQELRTLTNRVLSNAGLLEQVEPTAAPVVTPSERPSPTPSETPTPTPTQSPSPEPQPSSAPPAPSSPAPVVPSMVGEPSPEPSPTS